MEIRELRYFVHVARAGSFSRAAGELYVAQPALSRQIRNLEEELGVQLLVRYGRGVRLTSSGSLLLERADTILHLLQQTIDEVKISSNAVSGHIELGVPPIAGLLLAPPVIQKFRARWPGVSLHVREGLSSSLQEWALDRRIHVAVLHNSPPLEVLDIVPLLNEHMVLVGPPLAMAGKLDKPRANFRIRDLADVPLIMPSLPHSNRRLLEQAAVQHGVRLRIILEVDSIPVTKAMVRLGLGYTILTYAAVQDEVMRGDLCAHSIDRPPLISTIAIATLREMRPSELVLDLIGTVRATVRELVASGAWHGDVTYLGGDAP